MNIDATAMRQAGIGAGYIKNIINDRISSFLRRTEEQPEKPVNLVIRKLFNPNAVSSWFKSVVAVINQISLLTVVLTGAAVIREREVAPGSHVLPSVEAFRQLLAGDHLSRRRVERRLASVPDGARDRARVLRVQPENVPEVDRSEQVATALSTSRRRCRNGRMHPEAALKHAREQKHDRREEHDTAGREECSP